MFDVRSQDETMSMSVIDLGEGNICFACDANANRQAAWRWKDLIKTIPLLVVYLKCVMLVGSQMEITNM